MRRWLLTSVSAGLLLAGCASPGSHSSRSPSSAERLRLAAAAESNNNVEVALSIYRNAAHADPNNAEVQARYARALATHGAPAEAAVVLEEALARRPRDRTLLLALGRTQLRAGALAPAAESFNRLIEAAPEDPDALNGLGVIADLSGDHRRAQDLYQRGLQRAPQHEGLRNNLALSMAMSGSTSQALQQLESLRREGNVDVRVRHNMALVSAIAGDTATARQLSGAELDAGEQQRLISVAALLGGSERAQQPAAAFGSRQLERRSVVGVAPTEAMEPRMQTEPAPRPARVEPSEASTPSSRIVLQARAESWVQVRERASGAVVFDRVLAAGETYRVPDRSGLVLTAGNAGGLAVVVDGDALPPLGAIGVVRRDLALDPAALRQAMPDRSGPGGIAPSAPSAEPVRIAPGGYAPQLARSVTPSQPGATEPSEAQARSSRIVLRARSESWVQVRERTSGAVVFDRVLAAGETYRVPDRSGLMLTAGNAGGLDVVVDGDSLPPLGAVGVVRRDLALDPATLRQALAVRVAAEAPIQHSARADAPEAATRSARIVLRARTDAWVQVRERDGGSVVLDRIMRAGETYPVPGRPGLLMTTGNAAGLEVVVDGTALPPLGREGSVRRDVPLEPSLLRQVVAVRSQ